MLKIKEQKAIKEYKDTIINLLGNKLDSIILFGSKARGKTKKNSDIDLMILRTDKPKSAYDKLWQEAVKYSGELTLKYGNIDISPKIESKETFNNIYSPFFDRVKKEGILLWSRKAKMNL